MFLHDHSPDHNPPGGLEAIGRDRDYALGRTITDAISPGGEPPEMLNLLPQDCVEPRSARYFHKHTVLNY